MKKLLPTALAGLCCLTMLPLAAIPSAAAPAAPKITVDGKLDDWKNVHSIAVAGTGEFDGKKATFYGVLAEDGLYLACDAYHGVYTTTETADGNWHRNTNFEFFINNKGNGDNQNWVSAQGMTADNKTPKTSRDDMTAVMVTEEITDHGAAKYHTVTEVFLPNTIDFIKDVDANGALRVGVAWKTPTDISNNGAMMNGGNDEYWVPVGGKPNDVDKPVVNASGIYTQADVYSKGAATKGDNGGKWTADTDKKTYSNAERLEGNDFATYVLDNTDKKVTVSAKVKVVDQATEKANSGRDNGADSAIMFAVTDVDGDEKIEENGDFYYLVDISKTDEGPLVRIERNSTHWCDWVKTSEKIDAKAGDEVTLSATYDPEAATITVSVNGKEVLTYTDANPLQGTGYALASKVTGGTFSEVSVDAAGDTQDPGNGNTQKPDDGTQKPGAGEGENPPATGSASVAIAAVAVAALAGAVVVAGKRKHD